MGKKAKGKHRLDKFYYLAKEQGYRSRASFKLVQLNRKYDFFSGARACMDLCAAPGGWLQVAAKYMPMSSLIVGVDLAPIKPIRGCTTFVDDITTQSCRAQLKRCTPDGVQYDVVIHDGAPNVGGNFAAESYTQAALTLDSLRLATEFLKQGGWFITKVFRSTEYHALLYSMQQLFTKVESTKPVASRGTSAEIYVVCSGFLAPKKVDNRLLDPRHLFAEYEGPKQAIDVLSHAKRPRNRSGYEDGVSSLYKETPVETFILCDKPAELLGQFHAFLLDASNKKGVVPPKDGFMDLDNHPATTPEIRSLCADLGVLGRVDFKNLLKWRLAVRKTRKLDGKKKAALRGGVVSTGEDGTDSESDEDITGLDDKNEEGKKPENEDSKLLDEMSDLQKSVAARERRDKKKKAKLRAKERVRTALGLVGQDEEGATGASEMDLFSLARIKSKGGLDAVHQAQAPGVDAARDSDDDVNEFEPRRGARGKYDDSSEDDDENEGGGNTRLEAELDSMWREYKARQTKKGTTFSDKQGGRDKRTEIGAGEMNSDDEAEVDQAGAAMRRAGERALAEALALAAPQNPLLFDANAKSDAGAAAAALETVAKVKGPAASRDWFANDLFGKAAPEVGSKVQAVSEAKAVAKKAKAVADAAVAGWAKATREADAGDSETDEGFDEDDEYFAEGEGGSDEEDVSDDDEETEDTKTKTPSKSTKPSKKRAASGDDSDEEDYDLLRHASAVKKKRVDEREAKATAKAERETLAKASALKRQKRSPGGKKVPAYDDTYDDDSDSSEDDGGKGLTGSDPTGTKMTKARKGKDNAGFMEAPAEYEANSDSSDSESESDDVDDISDDEKAEILAIGKNMIRKKERDRIVDDAYNKYARDDDEDLPEWFLEDERKFMRPPPVYDQADLDEAKERLAAVDNRSIKKVAEAKFRKKKRAETKMSQARKRASTIMEQDDVPDVSKVREIEKIYAKAKTAARGKRREIKHVVARKFHKGNAGGPSVDKRMLNDARAQKRSLKAKGGVKKGGGGRGGGGGGRGGGNKGGGGGRGKKGF